MFKLSVFDSSTLHMFATVCENDNYYQIRLFILLIININTKQMSFPLFLV